MNKKENALFSLSRRFDLLSSRIFPLAAAFLVTGLVIRIFEYVTVSNRFNLPDTAPLLYVSGAFYDLLYLSALLLFPVGIYLLLYRLNESVAFSISAIISGSLLIIHVLLLGYFAEVLTPLGSDFFAYNLSEISDTVQTSVDFNFVQILPVLMVPAVFGLLIWAFHKITPNHPVPTVFAFILILFAFLYLFVYPEDHEYEIEINYTLVANKSHIFYSDALSYLFSDDRVPRFTGPEYPLLRPPDAPDKLGSYFTRGERPPNLVFVMVEGLGGTLMPPHDQYGGFTPFLDSLASESLYWTHFLATSGRSFNAQPSILGSLPYGERGFMDLGYMAPEHHTLLSILRNNNYSTNYFAGYDTSFDKLDQFLERQQTDLIVNSSRFTDEYSKMDEIEGGFTWGYSDKSTFRRAFDFIDQFDNQSPRVDIYFTLNFHEPFIIENAAHYKEKFQQLLNQHEFSSQKRNELIQYEEIFAALLYTDDAIRKLINMYSQRNDYEDTIFIITGDHRLIPIPHMNRIDRYYVPLIIYSPKLREAEQFDGISSHLDITPSLLAYLESAYSINQPDSIHWMGEGLNISRDFSADRVIPFMRNKNQMEDFLSGNLYLSGNQLFEVKPGMRLQRVDDEQKLESIRQEYNEFRSMNRYVTQENKLIRSTDQQIEERLALVEEERFFERRRYRNLNNEELFFAAREYAFSDNYENARIILRRVLRVSPYFHDARLLLGRTYGWDGEFEEAKVHFNEVIRRNPALPEAYEAKADLYYWQSKPEAALETVNRGLRNDSNHVPLLFRKARAYMQLGDVEKALEITDRGLMADPQNENLNQLKQTLQQQL